MTPSELRKIPATGGTAQTVCKVERSRGASWSPDGSIVIAPSTGSGLVTVSSAGGEPKPLTTLDKAKNEVTHRWPQVLPGGKAVLFTSHTKSRDFGEAALEVVVVATGERQVVHSGGSYGRYVPSGHLVYLNQTTLFAVPFDLKRLAVTGSPVPILQDVATSSADGGGQFSFSEHRPARLRHGGERRVRVPRRLGRPEGRFDTAAVRARQLRQPPAVTRRPQARDDGPARRQLGHLGLRPGARRAEPADFRRRGGERADLVSRRPRADLLVRQGRLRQSLPQARRRLGRGRAAHHQRFRAVGQPPGRATDTSRPRCRAREPASTFR